MNIKSIIIPFNELSTISINDTVGDGLEMIKKNDFLSLPVVEDRKFIGVLSKRYIYEQYFNEGYDNKEEFLKKSVKDFMKTRVPVLEDDVLLEDAADLFIGKKLKFVPVVNRRQELEGIITSGCILKIYKKIFGSNLPRLIIYTHDYKGKIAKISDIVAKAGGNIKNFVSVNTDIMDLQEIYIRVETNNINKVIKQLKSHGFDIREN
jgi:acetoin utilization protein AcuB